MSTYKFYVASYVINWKKQIIPYCRNSSNIQKKSHRDKKKVAELNYICSSIGPKLPSTRKLMIIINIDSLCLIS